MHNEILITARVQSLDEPENPREKTTLWLSPVGAKSLDSRKVQTPHFSFELPPVFVPPRLKERTRGFLRGEIVTVKALLDSVRHLDTGEMSCGIYLSQIDKASSAEGCGENSNREVAESEGVAV
jgi:hypothetical protein